MSHARHKNKRTPAYRPHKPSNEAEVTLSGRDVYLGPHGTARCREVYDRLIAKWLKVGITEDGRVTRSERGTPQGAVISPMLANLYLNPLDHEMGRRGWAMVRYADDFVVLCRTKEEA